MSAPASPQISVVIPVRNGAPFLREALDSVLTQDHPSFEVVVVDDGSTDETPEILASYGDRLRVERLPGNGVSTARNRGLALARGSLIAFLDADDAFLPGKLTEQSALFAQDPGLGLVNSGWELMDENGRALRTEEPWRRLPELSLDGWLLWKPVFPGALMIAKSWLDREGGFDPALTHAEDVDLVLRLAASGCRGAWLKRPTVRYRLHGGNAIRNGLAQAQSSQRVLDRLYARTDLPETTRAQEGDIRFFSLVWVVWMLRSTGCLAAAPEYARRALEVLRPPEHARTMPRFMWQVLRSVENLSRHVFESGGAAAELRSCWPVFNAAAGLPPKAWRRIEQLLEVWLENPGRQRGELPRPGPGWRGDRGWRDFARAAGCLLWYDDRLDFAAVRQFQEKFHWGGTSGAVRRRTAPLYALLLEAGVLRSEPAQQKAILRKLARAVLTPRGFVAIPDLVRGWRAVRRENRSLRGGPKEGHDQAPAE